MERGETIRRRNPVFRSLHKPLTYMGIERRVFFFVGVASVGAFNLFDSLLAGAVVFAGGVWFGYWVTNEDPAFLQIIARSHRFRTRYDASKQEIPAVEIR